MVKNRKSQPTKKQRATKERVAELNKKISALVKEKKQKTEKISSLLKEIDDLKLAIADIEARDAKLRIAIETEEWDCVHCCTNEGRCIYCNYAPPTSATFTF